MSKVLSYFFCFIQIFLNFTSIYIDKDLLKLNKDFKTVISFSNNLILCWLFSYSLEYFIIYKSNDKLYKNIRLYLNLSQFFNSLWLLSYLSDDIYLTLFNSFVLYMIHFFYITKNNILIKDKEELKPTVLKYMYFNCAWYSVVFFQNLSVIFLLFQFNNFSIISIFIGFLLSNLFIFGQNKTFLVTYYVYLIDKIFW